MTGFADEPLRRHRHFLPSSGLSESLQREPRILFIFWILFCLPCNEYLHKQFTHQDLFILRWTVKNSARHAHPPDVTNCGLHIVCTAPQHRQSSAEPVQHLQIALRLIAKGHPTFDVDVWNHGLPRHRFPPQQQIVRRLLQQWQRKPWPRFPTSTQTVHRVHAKTSIYACARRTAVAIWRHGRLPFSLHGSWRTTSYDGGLCTAWVCLTIRHGHGHGHGTWNGPGSADGDGNDARNGYEHGYGYGWRLGQRHGTYGSVPLSRWPTDGLSTSFTIWPGQFTSIAFHISRST
jgi:hypothetical protein